MSQNYSELNILSSIVKEQNSLLLEQIAKIMNLNEDESKEFKDEYLKPNIYCPTVVKYYKNETKLKYNI
jgi:hypothetical protein